MQVLLPNNEGNILKFPFFPSFFFLVFVSTQPAVQVAWLEDCSSSEWKDDKDRKNIPFFILNARTHLSMLKTTTVKPVLTEPVFISHPP